MAGAPTEFDIEREQENPVPAYSRCTTLRRFKGKEAHDLPFEAREELVIIEPCNVVFWYLAENRSGRRGVIPINFVEVHALTPQDISPFPQGHPPTSVTPGRPPLPPPSPSHRPQAPLPSHTGPATVQNGLFPSGVPQRRDVSSALPPLPSTPPTPIPVIAPRPPKPSPPLPTSPPAPVTGTVTAPRPPKPSPPLPTSPPAPVTVTAPRPPKPSPPLPTYPPTPSTPPAPVTVTAPRPPKPSPPVLPKPSKTLSLPRNCSVNPTVNMIRSSSSEPVAANIDLRPPAPLPKEASKRKEEPVIARRPGKFRTMAEFCEKSGWFSPTVDNCFCKKLDMQSTSFRSLRLGIYIFVHISDSSLKFVAKSNSLYQDLVSLIHRLFEKPDNKLSPLELELKYNCPDACDWYIRVRPVMNPDLIDIEETKMMVQHRTVRPDGLNNELTFYSKDHFYAFAEWYSRYRKTGAV